MFPICVVGKFMLQNWWMTRNPEVTFSRFSAGLPRRCPEVGFEEAAMDLPEARLWTLTTGQRDGGQLLPVGLIPKDAKQWVAPPGPLERAASSNLEASSAHNCFNVGL